MIEAKANTGTGNQCLVKILGNEYLIRGQDSPEYMERIAAYFEAQLQEIAARDQKLNQSQLAVLAGLKIADELHQIRQDYQQLQELLNQAR